MLSVNKIYIVVIALLVGVIIYLEIVSNNKELDNLKKLDNSLKDRIKETTYIKDSLKIVLQNSEKKLDSIQHVVEIYDKSYINSRNNLLKGGKIHNKSKFLRDSILK